MSQTFKLYRLQQIDTQLDQVHARLKEIELALSQDEALRQAQQAAQSASAHLQASERSLHRAEEEVRAQRIKIEQSEATLYGGKVRNPKELQDLQNEIAALKRFLAVLEDRQLEAMIAAEEVEAASKDSDSALQVVRASRATQNQALTLEQGNLVKDVARLEGERQAASSSIEPADLALYEKLRQQRRGVAVAKVTGGACAACGSTLNAALLHAARSPSLLSRCDSCGRILYGG